MSKVRKPRELFFSATELREKFPEPTRHIPKPALWTSTFQTSLKRLPKYESNSLRGTQMFNYQRPAPFLFQRVRRIALYSDLSHSGIPSP
jgi:hypothetical protein